MSHGEDELDYMSGATCAYCTSGWIFPPFSDLFFHTTVWPRNSSVTASQQSRPIPCYTQISREASSPEARWASHWWLVLGSWCLVAGVEPQHNVDYLERPLRKRSAFMIRLVLMSLLLALNLPLSRKSCGSNLRHVHTPTVRNLGTLWKSPSYMFFVVWIHLMTPQSSTHMPRSTG